MGIGNRFEPYRLPDTGYGGIVNPSGILYLLAAGLKTIVGGIVYTHHQSLLSLLEARGDVERKGGVSSRVSAHFNPIYKDLRLPVDCSEMEQDAFPFPSGRNRKGAFIPETLILTYRFLHTRKRRFHSKGNQDRAFVTIRNHTGVHNGITPEAIQIYPIGTFEQRPGILLPHIIGCQLFGPGSFDFVARRLPLAEHIKNQSITKN